jgi:hypothetical protein
VNGWRGDTSIQKRLEYDLYYLQNWSFFFDLRIIVLTISFRKGWPQRVLAAFLTADPRANQTFSERMLIAAELRLLRRGLADCSLCTL